MLSFCLSVCVCVRACVLVIVRFHFFIRMPCCFVNFVHYFPIYEHFEMQFSIWHSHTRTHTHANIRAWNVYTVCSVVYESHERRGFGMNEYVKSLLESSMHDFLTRAHTTKIIHCALRCAHVSGGVVAVIAVVDLFCFVLLAMCTFFCLPLQFHAQTV